MANWKTALKLTGVSVVGVFALAQVVPYGRDHSNPPTVAEPAWNSAQTRLLAERACFDCHSNLTKWPWYSHVAPASWLLQAHVDEGREALNFSEWNRGGDTDDAAEAVRGGDMPPRSYLLLHPEARLTRGERDLLASGLDATLGGGGSTGHFDDDD